MCLCVCVQCERLRVRFDLLRVTVLVCVFSVFIWPAACHCVSVWQRHCCMTPYYSPNIIVCPFDCETQKTWHYSAWSWWLHFKCIKLALTLGEQSYELYPNNVIDSVPNGTLVPYDAHYFWRGPIGLWSKVVHSTGNRVPFGTKPYKLYRYLLSPKTLILQLWIHSVHWQHVKWAMNNKSIPLYHEVS